MNIEEVINEYFPESAKASFKQCGEGAINLTYHITAEVDGEKKDYKIQKMNTVFDSTLMEDMEFLTEYLAEQKIMTPKVVKTLRGNLFVKDGTSWWRAVTYLQGRTFGAITSKEQAHSAGSLVGDFHSALLDCDYKFKFKLPHYRDTNFFMEELRLTLNLNKDTKKHEELKELAKNVISAYESIFSDIVLPERIIHGDLKIDNVLFNEAGDKAIALIDFDTFMRASVVVDVGDALRSWSMPGGEDIDKVSFDSEIYSSALSGYLSTAKFLTPEEKKHIPHGVKIMTLELASRFLIDAFNESYFNLDKSKYKNLFEQNKKKAQNQLDFFNEFSKIYK